MSEYITSIIAVSILSYLAMLFSYGGASERAVKAAVSMIVIYTVSSPVICFVSDFSPEDLEFVISDADIELDCEYVRVAEEAFLDGVALAVCKEFDIDSENIGVTVYGFDFEKMCAEKIKILLYGRAALADGRAISEYVSSSGLGDCEVDIGIY